MKGTKTDSITMICGNMIAILMYMLTAMVPIGTWSFSLELTPIESALTSNFTPEERHQMRVAMSRNRAELMAKNVGNAIIQVPILPSLGHYYMTRVAIGSKLYSPQLLVDTGSVDTWVQCDGCSSCFPVKIGNFKYKESSSYMNLPCNHPLCVPRKCTSDGKHCLYSVGYVGGGSSEGWVSNDTFTYLSSRKTFLKYPAVFGCGYANKNIRLGKIVGEIGGVFGLGAGPRSILMQLADQTHGRFSYCLPPLPAPRGSHSFLRFGDEAKIGGLVRTTKLIPEGKPGYFVNMFGISIQGKRLDINPALFKLRTSPRGGGFMIDSGTPYTLLVKSAYKIFKEEMVKYISQRYRAQPVFDLCYASRDLRNKSLPALTYHFEGADLLLNPKAVWETIEGKTTCSSVFPTNDAAVNILGAYQQADHRFLFDVRGSTVSFAPEICTLKSL